MNSTKDFGTDDRVYDGEVFQIQIWVRNKFFFFNVKRVKQIVPILMM